MMRLRRAAQVVVFILRVGFKKRKKGAKVNVVTALRAYEKDSG